MAVIYHFFLIFYYFTAWLMSFFNQKAKLWTEGQKNIFQELEKTNLISNSKIAWFHCASLGEYEQGKSLIDAFKKNYPEFQIIITFFSPSGYQNRHEKIVDEMVFYLPLDTFKNASRFIEIVKPTIVFFVKYEFWRNYLSILKESKITTICFSANFRADQIYFRCNFFADILKCFTLIFVQNEKSKKLLQSIDIKDIIVNKDTRFDRILDRKINFKQNQVFQKFASGKPVFIFGSVYQEDMKLLIPFINQNLNYKFLIFPHEINYKEIARWKLAINQEVTLLSDKTEPQNILMIDKVGLLADAFFYANFAYIGGGFGKGLHSILEPASYGIPIFFGNKSISNFNEASDLMTLNVAFSIAKAKEIEDKLEYYQRNPEELKKTYEICINYLKQNSGATERIMSVIKEKILSE